MSNSVQSSIRVSPQKAALTGDGVALPLEVEAIWQPSTPDSYDSSEKNDRQPSTPESYDSSEKNEGFQPVRKKKAKQKAVSVESVEKKTGVGYEAAVGYSRESVRPTSQYLSSLKEKGTWIGTRTEGWYSRESVRPTPQYPSRPKEKKTWIGNKAVGGHSSPKLEYPNGNLVEIKTLLQDNRTAGVKKVIDLYDHNKGKIDRDLISLLKIASAAMRFLFYIHTEHLDSKVVSKDKLGVYNNLIRVCQQVLKDHQWLSENDRQQLDWNGQFLESYVIFYRAFLDGMTALERNALAQKAININLKLLFESLGENDINFFNNKCLIKDISDFLVKNIHSKDIKYSCTVLVIKNLRYIYLCLTHTGWVKSNDDYSNYTILLDKYLFLLNLTRILWCRVEDIMNKERENLFLSVKGFHVLSWLVKEHIDVAREILGKLKEYNLHKTSNSKLLCLIEVKISLHGVMHKKDNEKSSISEVKPITEPLFTIIHQETGRKLDWDMLITKAGLDIFISTLETFDAKYWKARREGNEFIEQQSRSMLYILDYVMVVMKYRIKEMPPANIALLKGVQLYMRSGSNYGNFLFNSISYEVGVDANEALNNHYSKCFSLIENQQFDVVNFTEIFEAFDSQYNSLTCENKRNLCYLKMWYCSWYMEFIKGPKKEGVLGKPLSFTDASQLFDQVVCTFFMLQEISIKQPTDILNRDQHAVLAKFNSEEKTLMDTYRLCAQVSNLKKNWKKKRAFYGRANYIDSKRLSREKFKDPTFDPNVTSVSLEGSQLFHSKSA